MEAGFKMVRFSGAPTTHGGIDYIYDAGRNIVLELGVDDLGESRCSRWEAEDFLNTCPISAYEADLLRSLRERSPQLLEQRWKVPRKAWWTAYHKGDMYGLYWTYVLRNDPKSSMIMEAYARRMTRALNALQHERRYGRA